MQALVISHESSHPKVLNRINTGSRRAAEHHVNNIHLRLQFNPSNMKENKQVNELLVRCVSHGLCHDVHTGLV